MAARSKTPEQPGYLRHIRNVLAGLLLLALVAAILAGRDFLIPVTFAFFIALTFRPFIRSLSRRGVPAWLSTVGIAAALGVAFVGTLIVFAGAVAQWIAQWPELQRKFLESNAHLVAWFKKALDATQDMTDTATQGAAGAAEVVVREPILPTVAAFIADYPANFAIVIAGALVIALFMMASGDFFYEKLIYILPRLYDKKSALRIVYDVEREVSAYLLTISAINAGLGAAVGVAFWWMGMPMPLFWALFAFALNFVPYLGPIAGVIASGFVAGATFGDIGSGLLVPAIYIALIGVESQFVTPHILSRRMSINSVAILLSLAFWGWAWGIAGIVMAVPMLVTLRVFCSHLPALAPIGEFLSGHRAGDGPADVRTNGNGAAATQAAAVVRGEPARPRR